MTTSYGHSTYGELIDVVLADLPQLELKQLPIAVLQDWLLRAEERICRLATVREVFILRYSVDNLDYPFRDRPLITAATNATPIVCTCLAHGIANNSRVEIFGGQGNEAVNGTWFTSNGAADVFTINPGAYINAVVEDDAGLKVTTEVAHRFATGASITIAGMSSTPIPDGDYTVTVIDDTSFTIPYSPADATYDGGGVCYQKSASVGSGTFTGGARVWVDTEIPTYISKVIFGQVTYGAFPYNTRGYHIDTLNRERTPYIAAYPKRAAMYTKGMQKYLRLDPAPQVDSDITLYGEMQISPRNHYTEPETLTIHLSSEYDPMIVSFMKARAWERLGDHSKMKLYDAEFGQHVAEHNMNQNPTSVDIVYK